eukprot:Sspe_Gene.1867::Locus_620_Transcript_14_16_Confidence_0.351_Length_2575::g.1867::m.1867
MSCKAMLVEDDPVHAALSREYAVAEGTARCEAVALGQHSALLQREAARAGSAAALASHEAIAQESRAAVHTRLAEDARRHERVATTNHAAAQIGVVHAAAETHASATGLHTAQHHLAAAEARHGASLAALDTDTTRSIEADRDVATATTRLSAQCAERDARAAAAQAEDRNMQIISDDMKGCKATLRIAEAALHKAETELHRACSQLARAEGEVHNLEARYEAALAVRNSSLMRTEEARAEEEASKLHLARCDEEVVRCRNIVTTLAAEAAVAEDCARERSAALERVRSRVQGMLREVQRAEAAAAHASSELAVCERDCIQLAHEAHEAHHRAAEARGALAECQAHETAARQAAAAAHGGVCRAGGHLAASEAGLAHARAKASTAVSSCRAASEVRAVETAREAFEGSELHKAVDRAATYRTDADLVLHASHNAAREYVHASAVHHAVGTARAVHESSPRKGSVHLLPPTEGALLSHPSPPHMVSGVKVRAISPLHAPLPILSPHP